MRSVLSLLAAVFMYRQQFSIVRSLAMNYGHNLFHRIVIGLYVCMCGDDDDDDIYIYYDKKKHLIAS